MFRIKTYAVLFYILVTSTTYSQSTPTDSTSGIELFPKNYGAHKWKVLLALDARRSKFANTKIKINGLRIGATYKGVHRFGFGFYWLKQNVVFNDILVNQVDQDLNSPEVRFNLGYTSLFYERVFLKTRWWEVSFPVHLAGGRVIGTYKDSIGAFQTFTERPFSALIPTTQVKFFPVRWMALRLSFGYRLVFNSDKEIKKTFRTAFYGFGLSLNPLGLYRSIFSKEENEKKRKKDSEETR